MAINVEPFDKTRGVGTILFPTAIPFSSAKMLPTFLPGRNTV